MVTTDITELSDPKYAEYKAMYANSRTPEDTLNNKLQNLAEMKSLLSRLKGRKDDEVSVQAGICIPEGFIYDTDTISKDVIKFVYKQNDYEIIIRNNNTLGKDSTLLERGGEINAVLIRIMAHTLKKGAVKLPGINAEEWLVKGKLIRVKK